MRVPGGTAATSGFTLIEMAVVMALSAVVTLGIVAFYLSAQGTWTDASAQAVAQRDGTTLLNSIAPRAHAAGYAQVVPNAVDPRNCEIVFYDKEVAGLPLSSFKWFDTDSMVHSGDGLGNYSAGPVVQTKVARFHCSWNDSLGMIAVDTLRMVSASGEAVTLKSSYGLENRQ